MDYDLILVREKDVDSVVEHARVHSRTPRHAPMLTTDCDDEFIAYFS
jgi:hypothetical protein